MAQSGHGSRRNIEILIAQGHITINGQVAKLGDSVGPGGIMRALRNIPVLVGIARDMEELCPDAWMLNITNPMTTLCRSMTHETGIKTVGLCHEIAGAQSLGRAGAVLRHLDHDRAFCRLRQ